MSPLQARSSPRSRDVIGAAAAVGLLAVCWVAVRHSFYAHDLVGDTKIYAGYGHLVRHGSMPYRDFGVEYPPGALAVFVPPAYASSYGQTFGWVMFAFAAATVLVVARVRVAAAFYLALSPLFVGALVLNRFDFFAAFLAAGAVAALLSDRHRLGWAAIGAGVVVKLWPVLLVPVAASWTFRRAGPRALLASASCAAALVLVVVAPFAAIAPQGLWNSVHGQLGRPLQVETLGAALLKLTHHAGIENSYTTQAVSGVAVRPLELLLDLVLAVVLVTIWVLFARGRADGARLVAASAATIAAFVALGRVLSPQYTIWLVPLVPLVRGKLGLAAAALLAAAAVMAQVWYPRHYFAYVYHDRFAWLVLLRDLTLLAVAALAAAPLRRRRA